jgi:hypothetical protein
LVITGVLLVAKGVNGSEAADLATLDGYESTSASANLAVKKPPRQVSGVGGESAGR